MLAGLISDNPSPCYWLPNTHGMTTPTFFTLVIHAHSGAAALAKVLLSAVGQGYEPFEILLTGSGDIGPYASVVAKLGWPITCLFASEFTQLDAARNAAAAEAKGEWIWFLDDQDELETHALQRLSAMVPSADAQTGFIWLSENLGPLGENTAPNSPPKPDHSPMALLNDTLRLGALSGLVIQKTAFQRAGAFAAEYVQGSELELFIRCLALGIEAHMHPSAGVFKRGPLPGPLAVAQHHSEAKTYEQLFTKHGTYLNHNFDLYIDLLFGCAKGHYAAHNFYSADKIVTIILRFWRRRPLKMYFLTRELKRLKMEALEQRRQVVPGVTFACRRRPRQKSDAGHA